jgi:magnesium chelatase subunit D
VVDHEAAKVALVLAAVDPRAGGVALLGGHGTCKSTLARSLRPLLPRIETVRGSAHNADPKEKRRGARTASSSIDDSAFSEDSAKARLASSLATEIRDAPFLTIPLGATEDAVLGSVDIERSAATGEAAFSPGILARANRGVLFFDDANLLDDAVVDAALRATDAGYNAVEREGISTGHPCRCITIAAVNPSEGDVRATVLDRFAAVVGVDESLGDEKKKINADGGSETRREDVAARVAAATVASRWRDDWQSVLDECADREEDLRLDIAMARARIEAGAVAVPDWAIEFLVARAARGECRGHRAEICAAKLARAAAALRGADRVGRQDLRVAVELAIRPRDTVDVLDDDVPEEAPEDEEGGDEERESAAREEVPDEDEDEDEDVDEDRAEDDGTDTRDVLPDASFVFEPTDSELDVSASLLRAFEAAAKRRRRHESGTAAARSRSKASARDYERGRYVKSEFPRGGVIKKIAVDATLRAAAVHQFSRRRRRGIDSGSPDAHRVWIEKDDLRIKRMSRKAGVLTVFAVDASGSMALHRAGRSEGRGVDSTQRGVQTKGQRRGGGVRRRVRRDALAAVALARAGTDAPVVHSVGRRHASVARPGDRRPRRARRRQVPRRRRVRQGGSDHGRGGERFTRDVRRGGAARAKKNRVLSSRRRRRRRRRMAHDFRRSE